MTSRIFHFHNLDKEATEDLFPNEEFYMKDLERVKGLSEENDHTMT